MPWETLTRETIRAVVKDLGLARYTKGVHREKLVQLLKEVETQGCTRVRAYMTCGLYLLRILCADEAVKQRLQEVDRLERERARQGSVEVEYTGPPLSAAASTSGMHPVVEIPSRAGPSRSRDSVHTSPSSRGGASPRAKKRRIPPPSYAVLFQLEQSISAPSAAPVPLMHPDRPFEGVFLPPPRRVREAPAGEDFPESASQARGMRGGGGVAGASSSAMRLDAVEVPRPVGVVRKQWRQEAASSS